MEDITIPLKLHTYHSYLRVQSHSNKYNSVISASLNDTPTRCLADTGATFTAAPLSLAQTINCPLTYKKLGAISASGHYMPIIAQGKATLAIAQQTIELDIKFVEDQRFHNNNYDIILGCDTFAKLPPTTFNHSENVLLIGNHEIPMGESPRLLSGLTIRALEDVEMPPQSHTLIPIKVDHLTMAENLVVEH